MTGDKFLADQLGQLDKKLDEVSGQMIRVESGLCSVQKTTDKCEKLLSGNGEPEKGVLVRLDRAEQTIERQKKAGWILITAVVGQLIERWIH